MPEPEFPANPDPTPPEPIPVAQVWRPAVALPPLSAAAAAPSYPDYRSQGYYVANGSWAVARPYKPGAVTSLGVMSIVVASLTFVGSLTSFIHASLQFTTAQVTRTVAIAAQRAQAQQVARSVAQPAGPQGLASFERDVAINVFAARQPLSNERQAQLDAILATGGQAILNARPGFLTSRTVRAAITGSSVGRSPREDQAGPAVFETSRGSLELYDDHAVFRPADRGQEPIRAEADVNAYLLAHGDPAAAASAGQPSASAAPLPPAPSPPPAATRSAAIGLMAIMLEAGLSFLLAIYLLVTGILTLRAVRATAVMHWIYVGIKACLVGLAFVAWSQFEQALAAARVALPASTLTRLPPGFASGGRPWPLANTMGVLAVGYLVLIAVLLLAPATREFYRRPA